MTTFICLVAIPTRQPFLEKVQAQGLALTIYSTKIQKVVPLTTEYLEKLIFVAGLFRGAILESGSFLCTGMFQRNSRGIAFGTAALLNSTFESSNDSEALLQFLQSIDAEELITAADEYNYLVSLIWPRKYMHGMTRYYR
jgi:hypothetical protein